MRRNNPNRRREKPTLEGVIEALPLCALHLEPDTRMQVMRSIFERLSHAMLQISLMMVGLAIAIRFPNMTQQEFEGLINQAKRQADTTPRRRRAARAIERKRREITA